ncbi:MAG: LOG family protein [Bacteroidota bacterium]|nr:LOG family protein [Bacteroidota bacterium]
MDQNLTITVFGSSRPVEGDAEYELARSVGKALATAGYDVCNGGYGGTMEAAARGAKEAPRGFATDGKIPLYGMPYSGTIGVVAEFFGTRTNQWIDKVIVVPSLVERLMKLVELGDGYIILKGGTGTLLEFAAVWELMNKNVMKEKPIVVVGNFWNDVVGTLKNELLFEGKASCTKFVSVAGNATEAVCLLNEKLL